MNEMTESTPAQETLSGSHHKLQFAALCAMLALALVGVWLSEAQGEGARGYWMLVVFIYASLGIFRSTRKARSLGRPVMKMIGRELLHWAVLLVFMCILLFLEHRALINRQIASQIALLLLALGCCLAGIHFDWLLLVMGIALTGMVVAVVSLEQYSGVMWLVVCLIAAAAAGFVYLRSKRASALARKAAAHT
jgi:hypothetical protein